LANAIQVQLGRTYLNSLVGLHFNGTPIDAAPLPPESEQTPEERAYVRALIDTSIVRVYQHGACISRNRTQSMGRSRGGLTSKIHAVVDTNGLPVRLALTAGEAHDNRLAEKLLSRLKSGAMLLADRGYDADWIRSLAAKKGAWANIPPRCNRNEPICFSPYLYRARNLVERFFNRIKHCRRAATRYDKLAANYLAFVKLASIRLWLRANEYTA
jgi:transposase